MTTSVCIEISKLLKSCQARQSHLARCIADARQNNSDITALREQRAHHDQLTSKVSQLHKLPETEQKQNLVILTKQFLAY